MRGDPAGSLVGRVLPTSVQATELVGAATLGGLYPQEEELVARAVETRRREFATGRRCARAALGRLGYPPVPLLPGAGGAPVWPAGVRGSLTHCPGYAAAAVGSAGSITAIGIDAEPDEALPDGVLDLVATAAERAWLAGPGAPEGADAGPHWDRLLFSAKESAYKAWFPVVGEWIEPQQTEIRFGPGDGTFTVHLGRGGLNDDGRPVTRLPGRWASGAGLLLTAVVLPRAGSDVGDSLEPDD